MCKFCAIESGNCEGIKYDEVEVTVGRRKMESWLLSTFIDHDKNGYSIEASFFMDGGNQVSQVKIPINFCPFCGEKL